MNFSLTSSLSVSCGTPSVALSPKMQCGTLSSRRENGQKAQHLLLQRPRPSCRQRPAWRAGRSPQIRPKSLKLVHPRPSLLAFHEQPTLNRLLLAVHPPLCTLSDLHALIVHHSLRLSLHITPAEPLADLLYVNLRLCKMWADCPLLVNLHDQVNLMFTNTSIHYLAPRPSTHIVDSYYFAQRPSWPFQVLNTRGLLYITPLLRLFCCFSGHSARHPYNPSHEHAIQYSHHNPGIIGRSAARWLNF
jgi:hypothetical protein